MPVSEWVRRALREARRREPRGDLDGKLRAVRAATRHEFRDTEVLQEICHRYAAIGRREAIQPAFDRGFDTHPGVERLR